MSPFIHILADLRKAKFLLNSRALLVTAPYNCIYTETITGIPYTKGTGLNCRFPLIGLLPHTLGFSPRAPVLVLGTITWNPSHFPFHGLLESAEQSLRTAIPRFSQILIIMILPWPILVNIHDDECQSIQKCQKISLRYRAYSSGKGILTFFPFLSVQLGT